MTSNSIIEIELISEEGEENRLDNNWQMECKKLKAKLSDKINEFEADLNAKENKSDSGTRASGSAFDFSSLILSLTSTEMIASIGGTLWESLDGWLSRRNGCAAIIRMGKSEYHLNNLTKDEVIELMQKQSQ